MGSLIYYAVLFLAKVLDNALSTTKTILIQRSRWLLAGIAVVLSDFIYFWLTKRIVSGDNNWAILIVSLAGGVGCALACLFSEKLSKDRTYVNVIMSDNLRAMQNFRDFLATHHITNVAADTYIYPGLEQENHLHNRIPGNQSTITPDHGIYRKQSAEIQACCS